MKEPLETIWIHPLSLQKGLFGNEATKDSLQRFGSCLKRGQFNERLPLWFPCGPIHRCGREFAGGQKSLIWNGPIDYVRYLLTRPRPCANSLVLVVQAFRWLFSAVLVVVLSRLRDGACLVLCSGRLASKL